MLGFSKEVVEVIEKALKLSNPTEEEVEKARRAEKAIKERFETLKLDYMFVGSYARNTWLKENLEIDIFIFFTKDVTKKELKTKILEIGGKVLDEMEIRFAEHPYAHGKVQGVNVDLVPCYKVKSVEEIISAVDRTPFHHEWLKDRVKGKENEIRIFKQFLRANNIYGAEYKVKGFSGYLCELLIVFYGSFINCIKNATNWSRKTVIDVKNGVVKDGEIFFVIDPVDEKRNVAANLSIDNLAKFIQISRDFLKKPSIEFFISKKRKIDAKKVSESLNLRGTELIAVEFEKPQIVEDNLYPQLERAGKKIFEALKREYFSPIRFGFFVNKKKCYLIFECEIRELSKITRKIGPIFEDEKNVEKFLNKERPFKPFIENGRWWSFEFRRHVRPEEVIVDYIKEKNQALGKNVGVKLLESYRILKGEELVIPELIENISEFLGVKD
ncbi:MAG: CCA tRNA nucleotidyltransferase [Archaeoglobaceae archaeon]|nr:CCA tRNA nucleotidyltransferase [Archaeoglobaceae archaeon]